MPGVAALAERADFLLGDLHVSPARRRVTGPGGCRQVEPQIMLVFLRLLDAGDAVVTRAELFQELWGAAAVGDDSLNRAVAGVRQIACSLGSSAFTVETIPRVGYTLKVAKPVTLNTPAGGPGPPEVLKTAVSTAYDQWRMGLPAPDLDALSSLERAVSSSGGDGQAWGVYALLLRKAAEYAPPEECASFVQRCEQAARRALALDPCQGEALVALAGVVPICGNWASAREQLTAVLALNPDHTGAAHDMAVLEMATGRPSAARPIIKQLIARDPLAATFYYKRMYHLWTFGEFTELDQVSARALQLWPRHAAIWTARFWSLVFSNRAVQALRFLYDDACRPTMPPAAYTLLQSTCSIAAVVQQGGQSEPAARDQAVGLALNVAQRGPAQAVAALMSLCAMDAISEAFEVAYGYYLSDGRAIAPLRHSVGDPSITDQHRRVTQPLFIPSAKFMREDPRFLDLCSKLGLTDYWDRFGVTPDFLLPTGGSEAALTSV